VSELKDPAVDDPAENKTPAGTGGQPAAEHGAGVTVRRQEQAAEPVEDPFRQDSGGADVGSRGSTGRPDGQGGTANGTPGGHEAAVTSRQPSGDPGHGGYGNGGHEAHGGRDQGGGRAGQDGAGGQDGQDAGSLNEGAVTDTVIPAGHGTGPGGTAVPGGGDSASADGADAVGEGQPGGPAPAGLDLDPDTGQPVTGAGENQGQTPGAVPGPGAPDAGDGTEGVPGQVDPDADAAVIDGGAGPGSAAGAQGDGGLRGSFGPAPSNADARAGDPGEQGGEGGDGRAAPGKPGAEISQQEQQGEAGAKGTDGKDGGDGGEQEAKDQAVIQPSTPDAEVVHADDASSEASPDQNAEDPMAAMEQRIMLALEERDAKRDAEHKAGIDQLRAEHQQEMDQLRAEHKAEIDALKDDGKAAGDRLDELEARLKPESTSEADASKDPDKVKAAQQRSDRPPQGTNDPDSGADGNRPDQGTLLEDHEETGQGTDEKNEEKSRRRIVTSDRVSAIAVAAGAINTAAEFGLHATPEGAIGLGVLAIGLIAKGLGKLEKRGKGKND
jgi:hypothetical protein